MLGRKGQDAATRPGLGAPACSEGDAGRDLGPAGSRCRGRSEGPVSTLLMSPWYGEGDAARDNEGEGVEAPAVRHSLRKICFGKRRNAASASVAKRSSWSFPLTS